MRTLLGDIDGGGHTLAEIDLGPLARRAALPPPRRQVLRRQRGRKVRYLDAEIDLPDGSKLAIEVDGSVHREPITWWDDMSRHNDVVIGGQPVLRYPSIIVRREQSGWYLTCAASASRTLETLANAPQFFESRITRSCSTPGALERAGGRTPREVMLPRRGYGR
jgi:hypothetical protein